MAKPGMAGPERTHTKPKNEMPPVPELQGKGKNIVSGISESEQRIFHPERPISKAYQEVDNDLARDNIENDLPDADLQNL